MVDSLDGGYAPASGRVGTACQPSCLSGRGATASRPFAALRGFPRRHTIVKRHPRSVRSPDPTQCKRGKATPLPHEGNSG